MKPWRTTSRGVIDSPDGPHALPRPHRRRRLERRRVAAIEVGSNSIHMIVAEGAAVGGYRVMARSADGAWAERAQAAVSKRRAATAERSSNDHAGAIEGAKGSPRWPPAVREATNGTGASTRCAPSSGSTCRTDGTGGARSFVPCSEAVDWGKGSRSSSTRRRPTNGAPCAPHALLGESMRVGIVRANDP